MIKILLERVRQGGRRSCYPGVQPSMPERYRGRPAVDPSRCGEGCRGCAEVCPTGAVKVNGSPSIDLGLCLFCGDCLAACPAGAISFTREYRMAVSARGDLVAEGPSPGYRLAGPLKDEMLRVFGRSLKLRQLSAGGCNACESDVNVLGTIVFDLARFGIDFVASPRHADGLLVTGPVTRNMALALEKTYEAAPAPKIVIASGACAISGGPYAGLPEVRGGAGSVVPVDLFIPGCPPHPYTVMDGLLRLIKRIK